MSVLLEGIISKDIQTTSEETNSNADNTGDSYRWNGVWQFIRDRNVKVDFRYSWKSNEVPNDLIDYVSFEKNSDNSVGSETPKKRGRGRGRKKKIEVEVAVVNDETEGIAMLETENETVKSEKLMSAEEDIIPKQDIDTNGMEEGSSTTTTTIQRTHPLFGLWEGSFDVRNAVGVVDTSVDETMFLYTYAGIGAVPPTGGVSNDHSVYMSEMTRNAPALDPYFDELPPEQVFSYSVIKILRDEYGCSGLAPAVHASAAPSIPVGSSVSRAHEKKCEEVATIKADETKTMDMEVSKSDAAVSSMDAKEAAVAVCEGEKGIKSDTNAVDNQMFKHGTEVKHVSGTEKDSRADTEISSADHLTSFAAESKSEGIVDKVPLTLDLVANTPARNREDNTETNSSSAIQNSAANNSLSINTCDGTHIPIASHSIAVTHSTYQHLGYNDHALTSFPEHITPILGFGKNIFGRFAIIGIYDESTGAFTCEKRYLISKFSGVNRFRMPSIVNPALNSGAGMEDEDDWLDNEGVGIGSGGNLGKRKRVSSKIRFDAFEEAHAGGTGTGGKSPKTKHAHPNQHTKGMKGDQEKTAVMTASLQKELELRASYEHYLPDDCKLLGIPNHANANKQNISCCSLYRSAFFDTETGDVYEGGWVDGLRQGRGICVYSIINPNSPLQHIVDVPYSLEEPKPTGTNATSNANGTGSSNTTTKYKPPTFYMYEGEWHRGKEHGQGVYMDGNRKVIYEGEFLDGCKHGKGTYYFNNGDVYKGDFREGVRHGTGVYTYANGCGVYDGDWRDDKKHGKGLYSWYTNELEHKLLSLNGHKDKKRDNKKASKDGKGKKKTDSCVEDLEQVPELVLDDSTLCTYEGDFEHNQRHGRGVLIMSNGFYYDGQWDRGIMSGKGEAVYPLPQIVEKEKDASIPDHKQPLPRGTLGQYYQGTFKNGLREGRGSIKFTEGAEYEGRFREDRLDGHAGTLQITRPVPGVQDSEVMIPIELQADIKRILSKTGFGEETGH